MSRILHALSLETVGGVEAVFDAYLSCPLARKHEHHLLLLRKQTHEHYAQTVATHAKRVHSTKHWRGLPLPRFLRPGVTRNFVSSVRPEVLIIYNALTGRSVWQPGALRDAKLVYYERGAAWLRDDPHQEIRDNLLSTDRILCNSHAAARMLVLKFGVPAERCQVIYNPLRLAKSDVRPAKVASGSFKIGMAGRMVPVKGMVVGLHALRLLLDQGVSAELILAGTGPEEDMLRKTAKRLALADAVKFSGMVKDMAAFYSKIDVFLCPSLREPLGNVAIEAGASGCPVICTAVDGLPEVVVDGVTGICLRPTLPTQDYHRMGVHSRELPSQVYDPASDSLRAPLSLSPESVAAAVTRLIQNPEMHARMSQAAVQHVRDCFSMDGYIVKIDAVLAELGER